MLKKLNFFNHALASADFPEPVVLARPIDVERCWWVLAVCGIDSGFVAEVHLRGGFWSGFAPLPRGDESPVRRAMGVLICNTSAVV